MAADLKLGLNTGYWGGTMPQGMPELVDEAEKLGFDSMWTSEAYGSDCMTPLAWWGSETERLPPGAPLLPVAGPPAGRNRHGCHDHRPPLGRPLRPRPRRL